MDIWRVCCTYNCGTFINQARDHVFRGHGDSVDQLCWHPTHPDLLATAAGDKTVRIWDTRSQKGVATIPTKGATLQGTGIEAK